MKTFLVVNPNSSNGITGKRWAEIGAEVSKKLGDVGHAFTSGPMDAARIARKAIEDGYGLVVAVGGDGTINEVVNGLVNGFFADGKPINKDAVFGVLPRGTGGDFRRTFGWELDLASSLDRLRGDATRPFDVGKVEFTDHQGAAWWTRR
jgi:diacylglycerol kinase family enzyme